MKKPDIKITKSEVAYSGFNKIKKYSFSFSSFDGKNILSMEKEVFERKSAVAVLLYDPKLDRVVLIEQFRPGCFVADGIAYPLEIPAGLIDAKDQAPEEVAKKEAEEETNCKIEKIINIGSFFPEISFGSRKIYLFCGKVDASQIKLSGGVQEENEDMRISLVTVNDLRSKLDVGEIINSHTLIAVQWFFLNLDKVRKDFI